MKLLTIGNMALPERALLALTAQLPNLSSLTVDHPRDRPRRAPHGVAHLVSLAPNLKALYLKHIVLESTLARAIASRAHLATLVLAPYDYRPPAHEVAVDDLVAMPEFAYPAEAAARLLSDERTDHDRVMAMLARGCAKLASLELWGTISGTTLALVAELSELRELKIKNAIDLRVADIRQFVTRVAAKDPRQSRHSAAGATMTPPPLDPILAKRPLLDAPRVARQLMYPYLTYVRKIVIMIYNVTDPHDLYVLVTRIRRVLLEKCSTARRLTLAYRGPAHWALDPRAGDAGGILRHMHALDQLGLYWVTHLTENHLHAIADNCHRLRLLHLQPDRSVRSVGLRPHPAEAAVAGGADEDDDDDDDSVMDDADDDVAVDDLVAMPEFAYPAEAAARLLSDERTDHDRVMAMLARGCAKLASLELWGTISGTTLALVAELSELRELKIKNAIDLRVADIRQFVTRVAGARSAAGARANAAEPGSSANAANAGPPLRALHLHAAHHIQDLLTIGNMALPERALLALTAQLPNLSSLTVDHPRDRPRRAPHGVAHLVSLAPNLKALYLKHIVLESTLARAIASRAHLATLVLAPYDYRPPAHEVAVDDLVAMPEFAYPAEAAARLLSDERTDHDRVMAMLARGCAKLASLELWGTISGTTLALVAELSELRELKIKNAIDLRVADIRQFVTRVAGARSAAGARANAAEPGSSANAANAGPPLRALHLHAAHHIQDVAVLQLLAFVPTLRYLTISESRITAELLWYLAMTNNHALRRLTVSGPHVRRRDVHRIVDEFPDFARRFDVEDAARPQVVVVAAAQLVQQQMAAQMAAAAQGVANVPHVPVPVQQAAVAVAAQGQVAEDDTLSLDDDDEEDVDAEAGEDLALDIVFEAAATAAAGTARGRAWRRRGGAGRR
ncbi:hypothetical protein AMAG_16315 [Allomyces macrogynus ATCC 38327]|uniref:F-box domain-containing protein n=1 Tax=Allomyces macrogynus (strain ATCC 38327) TaxID=578462 RepID=A0A0L0TAZ1_ALLM3|nr:hypothetical protein AMAG_16315 [Allomyces macrogynus ATCC 38327]|eukprot:KNE71886.1 hypothetical protein AMAG_16315 [Allomyces macrogynus ATCC 38327]